MTENGATFEFHPNARVSIDARARNLLLQVREYVRAPQNEFPSQRHPSIHITDKDIVGEILMWTTDGFGRTLRVVFSKGDKDYEIADAAYADLTAIIDLFLKVRWLADAASDKFLESAIIDWCRQQLGFSNPQSLCELVSARCREEVLALTVWVPFAHLEVQKAFEIGPVRVDTITKGLIDQAEAHALQGVGEREDSARRAFQKIRGNVQGLAAAVISIRAEQEHAHNRAIEIADNVIGLLRCFSLAALTPRVLCPSAVSGSDYVPSATALIFDNANRLVVKRGVRQRPENWRITEAQLNEMKSRGLTEIGTLLGGDLTEFQRVMKSSLLAFSKGLTLSDLNDRLVYMMSALEGLFLRGDEPIQQNVGERMAFVLFKDAQARIDTVQNFKEIYGMRSQYIHHRVSKVDHDKLETFVRNAGFVLLGTVKNYMSKFRTKDEFLRAIDRVKFGGR